MQQIGISKSLHPPRKNSVHPSSPAGTWDLQAVPVLYTAICFVFVTYLPVPSSAFCNVFAASYWVPEPFYAGVYT